MSSNEDTMSDWRTELRQLSRRDPEGHEEISAFGYAMHSSDTDRASALVSAAVAESALQSMIETRIIPMPKARFDDVFGPNAPLSSFSSKIRAAYAFAVPDNEVRSDFGRLREIRNAFAHSIVVLDFKNPVNSPSMHRVLNAEIRPATGLPLRCS